MLFREVQRHGLALAENLAYNAEYNVLFLDVDVLEKLVEGVVQDRDVLFAMIIDTQGEVIVEKALHSFPERRKNVLNRISEILADTPGIPFTEHHDDMYHIFLPIFVPTVQTSSEEQSDKPRGPDVLPMAEQPHEVSGMVVVGISFNRMTKSLQAIQKQGGRLSLGILILAVIVSRALVNIISRPIQRLAAGTHRIARGDLSQEVQVGFPREIGELSQSFNQMMQDLRASRKELERWAQTLENRVQERTQEIERKNTRLTELIDKMKRMQEQLVHSEKMASLGQLVAGIAHEINNPVNFISSNMTPLKRYMRDIKTLLSECEHLFQNDQKNQEAFQSIKRDIDFEFLMEDLEELIQDVETGATRIKQIVQDLRNFSRLDEAELKTIDLHESLDTTLNLLGHIYEKRIVIHKQYGDIPPVECYAGQLNQVFMNLLANAAQSIHGAGNVWISTACHETTVRICIRDDGKGIPEDILPKIFDPFFTTKAVGEGTGLGLSISYGIIEKHQGDISVKSQVGGGTEFTMEIPLSLSKQDTYNG